MPRWAENEPEFARRFFAWAVGGYGLAAAIATALVQFGPRPAGTDALEFPWAFGPSTLFLLAGSALLQQALGLVRREKQRAFRRCLSLAFVAGTLFVGVQSYGLWFMLNNQDPGQASTGAGPFAFVLALLHGIHFTVALLFLVFVLLQARSGRYDHEYYWGVIVCTYFWHILGAVWFAILMIFAIAG